MRIHETHNNQEFTPEDQFNRLLVTGGAGFIGANFVRFWLEKHPNDEIVVLDRMTYASSIDRLPQNDSRLTIIEGDICDYESSYKAMMDTDAVVHFAAETHVDRSLAGLEAERLFFKTNVEGTQTLLYAAKAAGVKRFHHISTDEVFGDLEFGDRELFHEKYPYNPHNPYSISKAASDFVVRAFGKTRGLDISITNCTNNYGPYQTPEKMIPRSISLLLKGEKVRLYTDSQGRPGKNIRDWLHVTDHCKAIEQVLERGQIGETYCIGGKNEVSNFDLVGVILRCMSTLTGQDYSYEENVELVQDRPSHDKRYAIDISKINRELGWEPSVNFEDGIKQTVEWYLSDEGKAWLATLIQATGDVRDNQSKILP